MRQNVEALQLTGVTKIWRRDATVLGPMAVGSGGPFDLVFLDPPYRKDLIAPTLVALREGWLAQNALIVAECGENETIEAQGFKMLDERVYRDTRVAFLTAAE